MINFSPIERIGSGWWSVSVHGLLIAAGFIVAEILARREAKRKGINPEIVDGAALVAMAAGFIGARIFYLLFFGQGMGLAEMFKIWEGGLSSHGGYLFGLAAGLFYVYRRKVNVFAFADAVIPYVLIGWVIGRIGCFLNWDSYGAVTDSSLAVVVYGEARYPTQLFETVGCLISFGLLKIIADLPHPALSLSRRGSKAALALALFALTRIVVDFYRGDPFEYLLISRVVTLAVLASALLFLFWPQRKPIL